MLIHSAAADHSDFVPDLERLERCLLCSAPGVRQYADVRDFTFGTPGSWEFLSCRACGVIWLSPRPRDIAPFYAYYYTHRAPNHAYPSAVYGWKRALCAAVLKAPVLCPNPVLWHLARLLRYAPVLRETATLATMCLAGVPCGRLLDVGCGGGAFLELMRHAGWDVAGVEPDAKAAQLASRRLGLTVRVGQLADIRFPADSFDAVTLHHVIEHVYDPISLLQECRRILRPGGRIVVVTPNMASLGHSWFGQDWRGLEPPRHSYIFSLKSLRVLVEASGFTVGVLRTSPRLARGIWTESRDIVRLRRGRSRHAGKFPAFAFHLLEAAVQVLRRDCGEELILMAVREETSR